MATDFPGYSGPAASTEAPLEMLAACHVRIGRQCATLSRLVPHLLQHGSDAQARSAASNVVRYFDTAALDHHLDEEQDLFPALIESMAGSDAVCIKALTQSLCDEHRELEQGWRGLKPMLERIAAGEPATLPADIVARFVDLYEQHIRREEDELLPMAGRLLGDADIDRIGRAMRLRRGIPDHAL